jgi:cell division protein FtsW
VEQDRRLFIALAAVLVAVGVLMVHSASITSRPSTHEVIYLSRHLMYLGCGLAAALVAAAIPGRWWRVLAPVLFIVTLGLLAAVLVPGVGARINGAQRWFRWGALSCQPSELAKIALPLCLCAMLERHRSLVRTWLVGPVLFALPIVLIVPLVLIEPDLGTAVFVATGGALALFVGGWPLRNFILGASASIPLVVWLVQRRAYQMQRVSGLLAAWSDWTEAPYQLQQSLVTMGAGGVWGVGLGKGWQKLSFLPEANTDFVFAVIGEELGLVGAIGLIAVWGGLYMAGLRLLRRLPHDSFEYMAGFTLLSQLVLQAALNIAVVTALVPPKGIPHPLISYGGSNLVVSMVSIGLIAGLARRSKSLQCSGDMTADATEAAAEARHIIPAGS